MAAVAGSAWLPRCSYRSGKLAILHATTTFPTSNAILVPQTFILVPRPF